MNLNYKKSLSNRKKEGSLQVNACCGGARIHRANCDRFTTAKWNGSLGGATTAAIVAMGQMLDAVAGGSATSSGARETEVRA